MEYNKRIVAFLVDFIITAFIQAILMMIFIILPVITGTTETNDIFIRTIFITLISMIYLLIRDIIGTESLGKKILKLKIMSAEEKKQKVTVRQRILRNIPLILGPVEIIVFFINHGQRLGDVISKTRVKIK